MRDHSVFSARLRARVLRADRGYEMRRVCDENVLLRIDSDNYVLTEVFCLNDTAAYIWHRACMCDFTESDIVRWLTDRYDVTERDAEASAHMMAQKMVHFGLARYV